MRKGPGGNYAFLWYTHLHFERYEFDKIKINILMYVYK